MKRLFLVAIVCLLVASCAKNPFSTRDSEPPTTRAGTFIPPTTPQIVLENLRLCYAELIISNFVQCLDSNYAFTFDFSQGAQSDTGWNFAQEVSLTEKMFTDFNAAKTDRTLKITFTAQSGQPDVVLDSAATLVRGYTVVVADTTGKELSSFQGVARFEMSEGAFNFWAISKWRDLHLNLGTRSWAELKNAYR
jgi:hypothetical protein